MTPYPSSLPKNNDTDGMHPREAAIESSCDRDAYFPLMILNFVLSKSLS